MKTGDTITLNEPEQKLARYLANARHTSNRSADVKNNRIGPQDDAQTDLEGIGAEMAFCRMANVYPDTSISPRRGGADCALHDDRRVDVKATRYATGQLLAVTGKAHDAVDLYALMVGTFPTYRFAGWMPSADVVTPERLTDLGHGPTYAVPQRELVRELVDSDIRWG